MTEDNICEECDGVGTVIVSTKNDQQLVDIPCHICSGTGDFYEI